MVRGRCLRRRYEGQRSLEVPSVSVANLRFSRSSRAYAYLRNRMSGYLLFPLFMFVAHLGGGWSNFSVKNTDFLLRVLSYTFAPLIMVVAVSSRAR